MIMTNGRFDSDTAKQLGPITTVGKEWRGETCTFKSFRHFTIWNIFFFNIAGVTSKTRRRIALGLVASRKFRRTRDMTLESCTLAGEDGGAPVCVGDQSQYRYRCVRLPDCNTNIRRENIWCAAAVILPVCQQPANLYFSTTHYQISGRISFQEQQSTPTPAGQEDQSQGLWGIS